MSFLDSMHAGISRITEPAPEAMPEQWFLKASADTARTMRIEHHHGPRLPHEKGWQAVEDGEAPLPFPTSRNDLEQAEYHIRGTRNAEKVRRSIERVKSDIGQSRMGYKHLGEAFPAFEAGMLGLYAAPGLQIKLLRPVRIAGFRGPRWWENQLPEQIA